MSFLKQNKQYISTAMKIGIPSMVESFFVCLAGLIDSLMVSSVSYICGTHWGLELSAYGSELQATA